MNATLPTLYKATIKNYRTKHTEEEGYVFDIERPTDYANRTVLIQNPSRSGTSYCTLSNLTPTKIQCYPIHSIVGRKDDEFLYKIAGININNKEVPYYIIIPIHHNYLPPKYKISHEDLILYKLA